MKGHRDLIVWQKAIRLVKEVYRVRRDFPEEETDGLTNQLRRAAVSIPSVLSEGHDRFSRKEFPHSISHARGSLLEVETQLEIAQDLGYLTGRNVDELLAETSEIARLLNGLRAWTERAADP